MHLKKIFRGISTIVVGIFVGAFLSVATDSIMEAIGVYPSLAAQQNGTLLSVPLLLLATLYRSIYTVFSCFVAAAVAPNRPMLYVKVLGVIATLANLSGLMILPDWSQAWYPILLAVLAFPCAWLGGKLYLSKK